ADTAPAAAPAAAVTSAATSSAAGSLSAAPVTQPTLAAASTASGIGQYLQVGAFADLAAAQRLIAKLQTMTSRPVFIRSVDAENTTLHRVRIGPIPEVAEISQITELVVAADLGRPYTVRDEFAEIR